MGVQWYLWSVVNELESYFLIGFLAGASASMFNIPFDVAKSRIQGPQPDAGVVKYKGTVRTIALVYKEEGSVYRQF